MIKKAINDLPDPHTCRENLKLIEVETIIPENRIRAIDQLYVPVVKFVFLINHQTGEWELARWEE